MNYLFEATADWSPLCGVMLKDGPIPNSTKSRAYICSCPKIRFAFCFEEVGVGIAPLTAPLFDSMLSCTNVMSSMLPWYWGLFEKGDGQPFFGVIN